MAERDDLIDVLTDLRSLISKQTSYKFVFLRGILYGFGTVVGATILIGVASWFLTATFENPRDIPIIGDVLQDARPE